MPWLPRVSKQRDFSRDSDKKKRKVRKKKKIREYSDVDVGHAKERKTLERGKTPEAEDSHVTLFYQPPLLLVVSSCSRKEVERASRFVGKVGSVLPEGPFVWVVRFACGF